MATRHERVIVELDDQFTSKAARMAAATAVMRRNLDDSDRSTAAFDRTIKSTSPSIDQLSGRLAILTRAAAALGPGFVPIATAAVPALAGLSTQLGFAAAGAGTAVLAFNGIGDALKALKEHQLNPSAESFAKLQEAMRGLGPSAREFVGFLDEIGPQLQSIRETAQEGLLPGVQNGIDSLLDRLPQVRDIVAEIADASGDLAARTGESLAGSQWDDFFAFLENEARPALTTLGETVGNLAGGIAELWMAFDPLSDDFTTGLVAASEAFERWAAGLAETAAFEDFIAYIRETGPQVLETLGSLANMLIDIGTAAAPLGGPILAGIEAVAKAISAVAESDMGTPIMAAVAAMSALSLATKGWASVMGSAAGMRVKSIGAAAPSINQLGTAFYRTGQSAKIASAETLRARESVRGFARQIGPAAGLTAGLAVAATGLGDGMGLSNTASLALMGTIAGPWGAAIGGGIGLVLDMKAGNDDLTASIDRARDAVQDSASTWDEQSARIAEARANLAKLKGDTAGFWGGLTGAGLKNTYEGWLGLSDVEEAERDLAEIESQMDSVGETLAKSGSSAMGAGADFRNLQADLEGSTAAAYDFLGSLKDINAMLQGRSDMRAFEESIDRAAEIFIQRKDLFRQIAEARNDIASADSGSERDSARERLAQLRGELKDLAVSLDITTEAGRRNQENLDNIAGSALKVAETMQGVDRIKFLDKARDSFIDAARDMGMTRKRARDLADSLGLLDKNDPQVKVTETGADKTKGKVQGVQGALDHLDNSAANPTINASDYATRVINGVRMSLYNLDGTVSTTYIRTVRQEVVSNRLDAANRAQGGAIYGPGTATSDSIPAYLSNGEYVVRAAAVDKYGTAMFDRLNAMAYANGGLVEPRHYARGGDVEPLRRRDFRAFNPEGSGIKELRSDIREFRRAIRAAGGDWTKAMQRQANRLENVTARYGKHERALEKATDRLRDLQRNANAYRSDVAGSFNHDLYGNGVAGLRTQLAADRNDSRSMLAALRGADRKGLSGGLEKSLIASGDLNTAQQLSRMSRSQIAQLERLYASRTSAQNALGGFGRQEVFGRELAAANRERRQQNRLLNKLDRRLEHLEDRVERGAARGTARGTEGRRRNTNQRRRAGR